MKTHTNKKLKVIIFPTLPLQPIKRFPYLITLPTSLTIPPPKNIHNHFFFPPHSYQPTTTPPKKKLKFSFFLFFPTFSLQPNNGFSYNHASNIINFLCIQKHTKLMFLSFLSLLKDKQTHTHTHTTFTTKLITNLTYTNIKHIHLLHKHTHTHTHTHIYI